MTVPAHDRPAAAVPAVSIISPVRNERPHVEAFLRSVLGQEQAGAFELIVADGMSDDGTREVLERTARQDPRLRIIDNPGRIVSTGLNAAIQEARGPVVVRMDAHTEYAPDYVAQCLAVRESSGAENVGGPWRARGRGFWQSAIALAFHSPLASGGAKSHETDFEGEVDSVYLGCWSRDQLFTLGLFDEELVRNQDDELNLRVVRSGGRVWQSPRIRSWYFPRASLRELFAQYAQYSYWKVRVIQKHHLRPSPRHVVPGVFLACVVALTLLATTSSLARGLLAVLLLAYGAALVLAALVACRARGNRKYLAAMPLVFVTYHIGYGWGFLMGLVDFVVRGSGGRASYGELTR
jgi:glycosyltransferase involved in cell wall biosynthesis